MKDPYSRFFIFCLILYLAACKDSEIIVESYEGESATLSCKYNSRYHGKCHICWMKGHIPSMGCGDEITRSDGDRVVWRKSSRYQLDGDIQHGDVSLTITNVQKKDSGQYGCRIHVPGMFNDEMYYIHLLVKDTPSPTTWETTSMTRRTTERATTTLLTSVMTEAPVSTTQEPVAVTTILGHTTTASQSTYIARDTDTTQENSLIFNSPESSTTQDHSVDHESSSEEHRESVNTSAVIVPVLLILLAVIAFAVIMIWKQKRKSRAAQIAQNSENSVIYTNSSSSIGLYNREMAVDNIYHIETESEYEQWN